MQALLPVTVDLASGVVTLGSTRVQLERHGNSYVAPGGWPVRTLTFQERSRVIAGALIDPEPISALLAKLRTLANVPSDSKDEMADALLLALAGGGQQAPAFSECARAACRKSSMDWKSVQESPALLVDQIASATVSPRLNDEWIRFEFQEPASTPVFIGDCCRQMLQQLLARGTPQEVGAEQKDAEQEAITANPPDTRTQVRQLESAWSPHESGFRAEARSKLTPTTWHSDTHPLSARAKLILEAEEPQHAPVPVPMPVGSQTSACAGRTLPAAAPGWPQNDSERDLQPEIELAAAEVTVAGEELVTRSASHTAERGSVPVVQPCVTLKDDAPDVRQPLLTPQPVPWPFVANPMRLQSTWVTAPRFRAQRLRDLPICPDFKRPPHAANASLQSVAAAENIVAPGISGTTVTESEAPGRPERDWIHEIATALSEECDLRGLDL